MNTWNVEFNKYMTIEFEIENTKVLIMLDEGFFTRPTQYTPVSHHHSKHEFFFVKQGECTIKTNDKIYDLHADSFIMIPAGAIHNVCKTSDDARIYPIKMQFYKNNKTPDEIHCDIFTIINILIKKAPESNIFYNCRELFDMIDGLLDLLCDTNQLLYQEQFKHSLALFFIKVIRGMNENSGDLKNDNLHNTEDKNIRNREVYVNIIDDYFNAFYNKKVSLAELSQRLNLSKSHTRYLLKHIYNTNFKELLIQSRIAVAKKMLEDTKIPISEIAYQVGYDSYKGFSGAFKKTTGMNPTKFRKCIEK